MVVFVDTSALYAVLVGNDIDHPDALKTLRVLLADETTLLTTNYVLLETTSLLQRRIGMEAVRALQDDYVPLLQIDWITEDDHARGIDTLLAASRRKLSLVDCLSFRSMRKLGVATAFTFDDHFREQGFKVVPETA